MSEITEEEPQICRACLASIEESYVPEPDAAVNVGRMFDRFVLGTIMIFVVIAIASCVASR